MSKYKSRPLSPRGLKTHSLASRNSIVNIKDFAKTFSPGETFAPFINSLPNILAGRDFKEFISLMIKAKKKERAIIFALGAHVIKVGLNPVIIDLMKEGWVNALALNGAGIIHDFEIAFAGHTSEEVESQIKDGQFGMAKETGEILNEAINSGEKDKLGLGESVGRTIANSRFPHRDLSILGVAYDLNIPVTVHVAIGTDIIHFHPKVKGEVLGKISLRDFFLFCSLLEKIEGGGVFINLGSAVILPEVFLKAISFIRNKGRKIEGFSTAVFDFIHHYRPHQNVVKRPLKDKRKGFYFIGHHEIMIPLLAASLKSESVLKRV
ncbi:MAG: deoxyhypusine synthase family protein [Candidatus Aminicenantes bacterium]|nr:MAG: deoxyhypusine synthase family protein [Candidatus Aminicenantes bacterium]